MKMSLPVYTLSDSESDNSDVAIDSDEEKFLLGAPIPALKKAKNEPKKVGSCPKPKNERKPDLEKQKVVEKRRKAQEERRKLKEEKQKANEEKMKLKDEKKKTMELLKQLKPGECMKFIEAFIDSALLNYKFGGELLTALKNADVKYTVREQPTPNTISWQRNLKDQEVNVPDHIIVIWMWEELINLILSNTLNITINDLLERHSHYKLTVIIFEIEEYLRQRKIAENRKLKSKINGESATQNKNWSGEKFSSNLSREDIEMSLATLQLISNLQYKFLESAEEVGIFITQFTKAVAELPYKLQRNKNQENVDWFAAADSKECVRVDNDGNGLSRLWLQQLCQFPNVGLDVAQSIALEYSSPCLLMQAYSRCVTEKEGEMLLQNIQVRRSQGPLSSVRRVGPELSKKAYRFFTSADGKLLLSKQT